MSIRSDKRSIQEIVRGIYIRLLSVIAYNSFPYQLTVFLHKLRGVRIGKQSHIARHVYIDDRNPDLVEIGRGVAITTGVMILAHQRNLRNYKSGMFAMHCPLEEGKVVIEDGAHIGIGAILLPGITVGKGAIIGAGSVVVRDIPAYCVAVGTPAKVIKTYH